jgi:molybdate transport system substrate-binding protein
MRTRSLVFAAAMSLGTLLFSTFSGAAAELKVMTSVALTSALNELAPKYEKASGNKLTIVYGLSADMKKRILENETADAIILTPTMMNDLQKQSKIGSNGASDITSTPVAVAARAGAPKPDISSVDAFKQALLNSKFVVYTDPAKGGLSGVVASRVMELLAIAEQMKGKTILVPGAQAAEVVAKGEAELGIAQASEIVPVSGVELVGPLPGEFASMTVFAGAVAADSRSPEAAKTFLEFLATPDAAATFKAKGFEPASK